MLSKVRELLNDPESVIVWDVDGVLALLEWGEYNHYDDDDETWTSKQKEGVFLYTDRFAIPKLQDFIRSKDPKRQFSITKAFTVYEDEDKRSYVNRDYNIPRENVFTVRSNEEKVEVLKQIKEQFFPDLDDHKLIMVEDSVEILTQIMKNTPFTTVHISTFLCM